MFVTNSQLLDKINNIIISNECKLNECKLNECKLNECKLNECKLNDQLKEYLDIKFNDMINNSKSTQINNQKYNTEILNVIKSLQDETRNTMKNDFIYDEIKNISLQIDLMTEKMGSLYFENEIFKHQLSLEDDIRKSIDEINTITNIINNSVYEIDLLVKKIE
jgi:hypothetical protein